MLGKSTVPSEIDPKLLLYRPAPKGCQQSSDRLMSGAEIIAGLPTVASYGIRSDKDYYVYGFVALATSGNHELPDKVADAVIDRLATVIYIGAGGHGGTGNEQFYGTCGLSGSMDFHNAVNIPYALPGDIKVTTGVATGARPIIQQLDIIDRSDDSLWQFISKARDGNHGMDFSGSVDIENGADGPFRLLWPADYRIAGSDATSNAVGGGYGPGAGGGGGDVGASYDGGIGAPGGAVLFFELK